VSGFYRFSAVRAGKENARLPVRRLRASDRGATSSHNPTSGKTLATNIAADIVSLAKLVLIRARLMVAPAFTPVEAV